MFANFASPNINSSDQTDRKQQNNASKLHWVIQTPSEDEIYYPGV